MNHNNRKRKLMYLRVRVLFILYNLYDRNYHEYFNYRLSYIYIYISSSSLINGFLLSYCYERVKLKEKQIIADKNVLYTRSHLYIIFFFFRIFQCVKYEENKME